MATMDSESVEATNGVMSLQDSVSFFLSQYPRNQKNASSQKDETETIGMEASEDGVGIDEDEFGYMTKHPSKRRKRRSNLISLCILVSFGLVMFCAIFPLSRRTRSNHRKSTTQQSGKSITSEKQQIEKSRTNPQEVKVLCDGKRTYTLDEWTQQDLRSTTTVDLCDPSFRPESDEADMSQPVKVFIMVGESNMVGAGQTNGNVEGTLEYAVLNKKRFTHLVDLNQEWHSRSDVRYVAVEDEMNIQRNEWLGVNPDNTYFGPELQFGYILGELYSEPVLLIKAASGRHSLGGDLLPPGSLPYEFGQWRYPGYGGSPRRWPSDVDPTPHATWYAGHAYDTTLSNIQTILRTIGDFYPGATEYQVEGIAFWHGDSDRRDSAYSIMYQRNLRNLIGSLRNDLQVPDAKVAIATIGQLGEAMSGNALQIFESQMAMGSMYKDFQGNVKSIDTRSSWRGPFLPGYDGDRSMVDAVHYGNNAETVMEVGNALGLAMAKLLR